MASLLANIKLLRRLTHLVVVLGILCLFLVPSSPAVTQERVKVLRIGAPLALSGIAAEQSENIRKGLEFAREDLEKQGWKIEIEYEDTTAQAAAVVTTVSSMISRGFNIFVGPTWSYMVAAVKPIYQRADAVVYSPATSAEIIEGASPCIFHGVTKHSSKQPVAAAWLKTKGFSTAAIIVSETAWGALHKNIFNKAAKEAGLKVLLAEAYGLNEEAEVLRIFAAKAKEIKPDVILADMNKGGAAVLLKRLREMKLKIPILGANKVRQAFDFNLVPKDPDTAPVAVFALPLDPDFSARFEKRYREKPGIYADSAYDGLMILAEACSRTDGTSLAMRKYLHDQLDYHGVSGRYKFDSDGNIERAPWQIIDVWK